jgi:hypothetical protein
MTRVTTLGFVAALLLGAGALQAQEPGGVKVGGDVEIDAEAGDINNQVQGDNATGAVNVGAVTGANTTVDGDVTIDAKAGDINNQVQGDSACGSVNVGVVGGTACQQ